MTGSKNQCINWLLEAEADIFDVAVEKMLFRKICGGAAAEYIISH